MEDLFIHFEFKFEKVCPSQNFMKGSSIYKTGHLDKILVLETGGQYLLYSTRRSVRGRVRAFENYNL